MFFHKDNVVTYYIFGGLFFLVYTWYIIKKNYSIEKVIHIYLIIAPLYNIFFLFHFFHFSIANFLWVIFLPLGAYIFFAKREIIYYSIYSIIYVILLSIIFSLYINNNQLISNDLENNKIIISDTILIISCILIMFLAVYYNDKIRDLRILSKIEKTGIDVSKLLYSDKEIQKLEEIFMQLENAMTSEKLYKDSNFNISKMSVHININSGYISKSIRYKEFANFNSYLNKYRIDYAKELMQNIDYQKLTLLYVYSESGFANQVTFNRVFKQIEGITPTEYIDSIKNNKT